MAELGMLLCWLGLHRWTDITNRWWGHKGRQPQDCCRCGSYRVIDIESKP